MEIKEPSVRLIAVTPDCEKVIEEAGRTCYLSLERITESSSDTFIQAAVRRGHLSIIEHASATFRINGASRAFTHQMVRHRLASYSQQSQRYVDESDFNYILPPGIEKSPKALEIFREHMKNTLKVYGELREAGALKEDARFVLPNALESEIVLTANFRELRSIFNLRLEKAAQWEIRRVCYKMLEIMKKEAPAVFGDYVLNPDDYTAYSGAVK